MQELITKYGAFINSEAPLEEYPRPRLVRPSYFSFNGRWNITIYSPTDDQTPKYSGEIIVPFAVETALSGVPKEAFSPGDKIVYQRKIALPKPPKEGQFAIHFEAIDYHAQIYFNGEFIGEHQGGYEAIRLKLPLAKILQENLLMVVVWDDTNNDFAEKGKQSLKPGGMWYTPTSGIYQSVWGEFLTPGSIENFTYEYDFNRSLLTLNFVASKAAFPLIVSIPRVGHSDIFQEVRTSSITIPFVSPELWSPEHPHLYLMLIRTPDEQINCYLGIRQVTIGPSQHGPAVYLNQTPVFVRGLLDQGYYPESGLTPPSDQAIIDDLILAKRLGFNCLRVHMKKAPPRYLYHADRLGLLIIQDIPAGGKYSFWLTTLKPTLGLKKARDDKYRKFGRAEMKNRENYYRLCMDMINDFAHHPSLIMWCPFNEGWGQFDAEKAYNFFKKHDKNRLVDTTSGWFDVGVSDFQSEHIYFKKINVKRRDQRPYFLSEFGGYSYVPEGHAFNPDKVYGYRKFVTQSEYQSALHALFQEQILPAIADGLCGFIYTQLSDVEEETNGLISFDRKAVKVDESSFRQLIEQIKF